MGFGFKGHFNILKFDSKKFAKELDRKSNQLLREAAREWVMAAYVRVPVWTGMARGAFKYAQGRSGPSAGVFLSVYLRVLVPIGPRRTYDGEPLEVRSDKSPQLGGRKSRYTISGTAMKYTFSFSTGIPYFESNDQEPGRPPSYTRPWNSMQAGNDAFKNHIRQNASTVVPKVSEYLTPTKINLSNG